MSRDAATGRMLPVPIEERFWTHVTEEDRGYATPCWIWTGGTGAGYGRVWHDGTTQTAHRVGYELVTGETVPPDRELDHLCRVRLCVRALHLEVVTPRENVLRSPTAPPAINAAKVRCRRGHEFTGTWRGRRTCRECSRIRTAESRARRGTAA